MFGVNGDGLIEGLNGFVRFAAAAVHDAHVGPDVGVVGIQLQ